MYLRDSNFWTVVSLGTKFWRWFIECVWLLSLELVYTLVYFCQFCQNYKNGFLYLSFDAFCGCIWRTQTFERLEFWVLNFCVCLLSVFGWSQWNLLGDLYMHIWFPHVHKKWFTHFVLAGFWQRMSDCNFWMVGSLHTKFWCVFIGYIRLLFLTLVWNIGAFMNPFSNNLMRDDPSRVHVFTCTYYKLNHWILNRFHSGFR